VINFKSFNIGENEAVNFIQPSTSSSVLSRVTGDQASQILGSLTANGILFLSNPQGIYLATSANVKVNTLVASTLDISTNNFVKGNYVFEKTKSALYAQILNAGNIQANNLALIASGVQNTGIIQAKAGTVHLASGDKTTVSFDTRGLIKIEINQETTGKVVDFNGATLKEAVANSGTIEARQVVMSAKTASNIFENAINQNGIIKATKFMEENGAIRLSSEQKIKVSGKMEAESIEVVSKDTIKVNSALNTKGNTKLAADKDIIVDADIAVDSGNLELLADNDLDGEGAFRQAKATTISTFNFGDITIQASQESSLANINSAGSLILRQAGLPAIFNQHPDSKILTGGSLIIEKGVALNAADTKYNIGKDWVCLGVFNPDFSTVSLTSPKEVYVFGNNIFYNFSITVPEKIVRFEPEATQTIIGILTLKGEYGKLLILKSFSPPQQWKILPQGTTDIVYTQVSDSVNIRGPPLVALHSSSAGNLSNWDLDPFWTGEGINNNWSCPDNWDTGRVPTQYDRITFDGITGANPNKNSIIDSAFAGAIDTLIVNGYSGRITLARDLTLSGDLTVRTGTFAPATYSVIFTDASKVSTISGNNTFYNFTCLSPGKTIVFQAGTLTTIENTLTIEGSSGNNVILKSSLSGEGNEFGIYINAVSNALDEPYVEYVTVSDSNAYGPIVPIPGRHVNGMNNAGWDATRTISDSGGTRNWDDTASWVEGVVPGNGDDVVATATSGNLAVNVDTANLKSFDLTNYTGTLSGSNAITVQPSSGTVNCLFAGTISWTGTLNLNPQGTSTINFTSGGKTLNAITINGAETGTVSQQDNLVVTGAFTVSYGMFNTNDKSLNVGSFTVTNRGTFTAGASNIYCSGDVTITPLQAGDFSANTSTFILNGTSTQGINSARNLNNLTLSNNSVRWYGNNLTIGGNLTISEGYTPSFFDSNDLRTLTITGTTNGTAGGSAETLTVSGFGSITFTGAVGSGDSTSLTTLTITYSVALTFSSTLNITGNLTQSIAATGTTTFSNTVNVGSATLRGTNYSVNNSFTATGAVGVTNSGTFTKGATGAITAPTGFSTTGAVNLANNISTTNSLISIGAALTIAEAASPTLSSGSDGVTITGATDGTAGGSAESLTIDATGAVTFNSTVGSGSSTKLTTLTITNSGSLNFSSPLNLTGTLSLYRSSGVTFGNDLTVGTFYAASQVSQIIFHAGSAYTITTLLDIEGASGNLISLRSSVTNTQWTINPQGTRIVSYVDVKDSDNINAAAITPTYSKDSGNNTNWILATYFTISGTTPATAGANNELTITAYDYYGNVSNSYTGDKSPTFSGLNNALTGEHPQVEGANFGTATTITFTNGVAQSGAATLVAYRAESASVHAEQGSITSTGHDLDLHVDAAGANNLNFSQQPSNTVAGQTITPAITVQVRDQYNNVRDHDSSTSVSIAIKNNAGGGTLSGTTPRTASSGIATFNDLGINKSGTGYTLEVISSGLTSATSSSFNITGGASDISNVPIDNERSLYGRQSAYFKLPMYGKYDRPDIPWYNLYLLFWQPRQFFIKR